MCDTPRVAGGSVRFTIDDGDTLTVSDEDLPRVYDELWRLAPQPGAVTAAALVHAASLQSELTRRPVELTATQGAMLREAIARLHTGPA
ncbi:MAG: hypothetical protein ACRDL7_14525 [Gaiellaceae bacterium]